MSEWPAETVIEQRMKSKCASLELMYERYVFWVEKRSGRRGKFELLSQRDFNDDLRTNHGWESMTSGTKRWMGKFLTSNPPEPSFEARMQTASDEDEL
jgi:hypothetical protein